MRVVSGRFRGTKLDAVSGDRTRPTTDKVKEAMFSMLRPYLSGGSVLDLYAGTGGLAIEAVSQGMTHATLVDRQFQAIKVKNTNYLLKEFIFMPPDSLIKGISLLTVSRMCFSETEYHSMI